MQESIFPSTIHHKLYNERAILIGTFLGGPLVAGYLIAQNFRALDESAKIGRTWLVVILVFLLAIGSGFIPFLEDIPAFVYSFAFCMAAHFATKRYQGSRIALHQANGGRLYTTGRAVLTGLVGTVLMIALFLGLFFLTDPTV